MSERYETGCLSSISTSFENSMLEIGNFRPELHVAQQSRREKLRVPQSSSPSQTLEDFPIHSGQLPIDPGLNPDLIQNRNFRSCGVNYDTTILSSEMLNFSTNSYPLHHESGARRLGRLLDSEDVAFGHSSCSIPSNFKLFGKANDPRNTIYWKGSGSHQNRELTKYVNGSEGNACNQNPPLVGGIIAGTMKINSIDESSLFSRHGYNGYQDVQSSLANPSNEISNGQAGLKHYGNMRFNSPICRNTLEDVVTSSTIGNQGFDAGSLVHQNTRETGSLTNEGSELALLPAYGNASGLNNAAAWMHKSSIEGNHHWSGELCFSVNKNEGDLRCLTSDFRTQGLSLSLSSRPSSEMHSAHFGERFGFQNLQTGSRISNDPCPLDTKTHDKSNYLSTNSKLSMVNKSFDNSVRDTLGPSTYQNTGPLGPFTGYATILNSSKFLKPAQQLLGEICSATGQKVFKSCAVPERSFGDVSISGETVNTGNEIGEKQGTSSVASTLNTSNEAYMEARATASDNTGIGSESFESHRPECQQRKAKLIYMQEEVCRRYKQYHLQMQMVVSSFESVAGLSAATPYTSLAIKTVSKHFRCLKNAISDQLQHVGKAMGDDLSSPTTIAGSSKGDTVPRLKFIDQSLRNHKSGGSSLGYLESQQHVWRPQRGLPERSVAILRAWLFEHFLHPYPTDNDKHMLATQTGLSRNQVSNWFINARVRVWKPMVEEIHMLETKGLAETDANHGRNDRKRAAEGGNSSNSNQPPDNVITDSTSQKRLGCSRVEAMMDVETGQKDEELNQGKRLRAEFQIPASMEEGSLISVVPFRGSALEIGELGAVSLTLGLRHNAESVQQQLQQQEHHQLMRQFGGEMIHDFVG